MTFGLILRKNPSDSRYLSKRELVNWEESSLPHPRPFSKLSAMQKEGKRKGPLITSRCKQTRQLYLHTNALQPPSSPTLSITYLRPRSLSLKGRGSLYQQTSRQAIQTLYIYRASTTIPLPTSITLTKGRGKRSRKGGSLSTNQKG